ncbi:DUF423 domain-containing protein [Cytophagaceae bacterium DM2B3-1]|uniref:DUF423 domain-containing protein n=1 Tax=Xanthocytophaga flava TaxID=3048013 RepID=A0ABT7CWF4_9BACT|nr:DUF423 domain-containing protein [Xanthocytophaga flavus]MDJ1498055.1 DUF423 domain-containing protein [Xanthocytophaga flavus]
MQKFLLLSGAILGGLGVGLGAFGAHALKPMLEASQRLDTYETAVKYQFYHAFALLITGLLAYRIESRLLTYAGYSFLGGTLIFSGSLYILCLSGVRWLGAITPIGGVLMIIGWVLVAWVVATGE